MLWATFWVCAPDGPTSTGRRPDILTTLGLWLARGSGDVPTPGAMPRSSSSADGPEGEARAAFSLRSNRATSLPTLPLRGCSSQTSPLSIHVGAPPSNAPSKRGGRFFDRGRGGPPDSTRPTDAGGATRRGPAEDVRCVLGFPSGDRWVRAPVFGALDLTFGVGGFVVPSSASLAML